MKRSVLPIVVTLTAGLLQGAGVTVLFDPRSPEIGPFPTDFLTAPDYAQKTGKRVSLPLPDCVKEPSTCVEIKHLNELDGFNVTPRLAVRFSGPIQPDSIRNGLFLVALENLTNDEYGLDQEGQVIPMNQVVYDPATNTAYAKPDEFIDQHRRFLLVVTSGVLDNAGDPVNPDWGYSNCVADPFNGYCLALSQALKTAAGKFGSQKIAGSSIFTTMSATAFMESARAALQRAPNAVRPAKPKSLFTIPELSTAVWHKQTRSNPVGFEDELLPFGLLQSLGGIAFGSFVSPSFLDNQVIAQTPTGLRVEIPRKAEEIPFHVLLPASPKPSGGYPVVVYGHGFGDSRFIGASAVSQTLASAGFATMTFHAVGHGYGPRSTIVVKDPSGTVIELPGGGRGVDLNGDGKIDDTEGCVISVPAPVGLRDCFRQTALDEIQAVRAIKAGIDLDGDGNPDLDASRIFFLGQSLGSMYGTLLHAVEPSLPAAVLNVGGASAIDVARWSESLRSYTVGYLARRTPSLLNKGSDFDENYVLRYQPAKVNTVPGAIEIQNFLERMEWLSASGDPVNFAPHFLSSTLPGVPIKSCLFLMARGDRTVPNQTQSALVRAANMSQNAWLYRHDIARGVLPKLPENPHVYMLDILSPDNLVIALSVQAQVASFFTSGGLTITDPNNLFVLSVFKKPIFEVPDFLPEDPGW